MTYLTVFTIPKGFTDPHITLIQRNALASWRALGGEVETLVFGDDPGVADAAAEFGATHISGGETNEYGTPLLNWTFREAAKRSGADLLCYVNADIVLLEDFLAAIRRMPSGPFLAIGQRWNCDVTAPLDLAAGGVPLREWAREQGTLDEGRGADYFVYRRETDFGLPPFAVGRPGWDNWMMGRARALKLPLIDLTPSVTVIHQNHHYGHVPRGTGVSEGPEADRNRSLAGTFDLYMHSPSNATHLLTPQGLRPALSRRHVRARTEEFVSLRPAARPVRWAIKSVRRHVEDRRPAASSPGEATADHAAVSRVRSMLRWLGGRRAVMPLTSRVICARIVRESGMFFARDLARRPGVTTYHVRDSGRQAVIRHGTTDVATLAEVFYHRYYEPVEEAQTAMDGPSAILDLGANIGLFGVFATARWPRARVVAYEPDPANADVHERTIEANGGEARWQLVRAAAGVRDGEARFAAGLGVESHLGPDAGEQTIAVPVVDVIRAMSGSDLVKIDIEGGEWEILLDPRLAAAPPRAIVLEYHPRSCPRADPHAAAQDALARAGMRTATIWRHDDGHGMLWAWRPTSCAGQEPETRSGC